MSADSQTDAEFRPTGPAYCTDHQSSPIDPATGQCEFDDHTHCPFCWTVCFNWCRHHIGADSGEGGIEVAHDAWPKVAQAAQGIWETGEIEGQPLEDFFGPLTLLFQALYLDTDPLVELFQDCPSVVRLWWEDEGMGGTAGHDYYTPTPEADNQIFGPKLLALLAGMEQFTQSIA